MQLVILDPILDQKKNFSDKIPYWDKWQNLSKKVYGLGNILLMLVFQF